MFTVYRELTGNESMLKCSMKLRIKKNFNLHFTLDIYIRIIILIKINVYRGMLSTLFEQQSSFSFHQSMFKREHHRYADLIWLMMENEALV